MQTPAPATAQPSTAAVGRERRVYPRFDYAIAVRIEVREQGLPPYQLEGTSVNLSRGGVLVRVQKLLAEGTRCEVRFLDSSGRVTPLSAGGRILYRRSSDGGEYAVVIKFERPLDEVSPPQD